MKSIVVANWKMNPPSAKEARKLFDATKKIAAQAPAVSIVVAPPALYLNDLARGYRGTRIQFAAQHAHESDTGAHTGEISLAQVKDSGARQALIGHAERRALGETNEDTRKKVARALALKMTPILCVGERERSATGDHLAFVKEQVRAGLSDVSASALARVIVAYEPVWAIGAVSAMEPRQMHEMTIFIRKSIVEAYGERGHGVKILYGGAVDAENAPAMLTEGDVDGLLVGRASTDAAAFKALVLAIQNI